MISVDAAYQAFGDLHRKASEERRAKALNASPALAAGRALGLDGPLTLEALVTTPTLGALSASPVQTALLRSADGRPANDLLPPERMIFHFGAPRLPENDNGLIHTGERLPSGRPRYVILRTGVRAGKTLISVLALLLSVLTCRFRRPPKKDLGELPGPDGLVGVREGELVRALIVAPRLENTRAAFAQLIATMRASPKLRTLLVKAPLANSCLIRRPDGQVVEIKRIAADIGGANLRSTWLAGALFDEADFHDGDDAAVNLTENLRACRARLLEGAQIWIPSSPWAEDSAFDRLFKEAFKAPLANGTLAFHSDTVSMNPTIDREEMARERASDPDNAAREYDAIPFGAGTTRFFPNDAIEKCVRVGRALTLPPTSALHYAGADYGLTKNSAAQAIARPENGKATLVHLEELRPTKDQSVGPALTVPRFLRTAITYNCRTIRGDHYLAPLREEERAKFVAALPGTERAKVPVFEAFDPNRDAQAALFAELKRRMQAGEVEFPDDPRLLAQLKGTTVAHLPGGATKIVLPKQGQAHGDILMAVALAIVACPDANRTETPQGGSVETFDHDAAPFGALG